MSSATRTLRILVSDDQPDVRDALRLLLKTNGYGVHTAGSPDALIEALRTSQYDAALIDMNYTRDTTSGREGIDLVTRIQRLSPEIPVIVMTAWGSINLAVEAMRHGACDFVEKPWDNAKLLEVIGRHAGESLRRMQQQQSEIDIARRVQQRLLPARTPSGDGFVTYGLCSMAGEIGGDAYDFLNLGNGRLGIVLADVSGKGTGAALLMAHLLGLVRMQCESGVTNAGAMLERVNRLLHASTPEAHYATLFFAIYDQREGSVDYVNCGHPPALVLRDRNVVEKLDATATVLGAFPSWTSEQLRVKLEPGDTLVLYSDGVTEATSADGEEFGESRLAQALQNSRDLPALLSGTVEQIRTFCGGKPQDDLTLVALSRT